jgi:hypothetical protein
MGLKLIDLLRWNSSVTLRGLDGEPIERDGKPVEVFLRVLGDHDLEEAYKASRAASARVRKAMRDKDSDDYLSGVSILEEADRDSCYNIIQAAASNDFASLATANVPRPDLPKLEEVALDPDAPTLEEQEKLDKMIEDTEDGYIKAVTAYRDSRMAELRSILEHMSDEELRARTIEDMGSIRALEAFIKELREQKTFRAAYMDGKFKERAFDSIAEFRSLSPFIKEQIEKAYASLELNPDDIKN